MKVGDTVVAIARPEISGRRSYQGKLVRLTDNIAEVQGAPFEVRPFSRRLWDIKPVKEAWAEYRLAQQMAAERHAAVKSFDEEFGAGTPK